MAQENEPDICIGEFIIRWTGWKNEINTIRLIGQWVATKQGSDSIVFAGSNGVCGFAKTASVLDTCYTVGREWEVNIFSSEDHKNTVKQSTLAALIEYLKSSTPEAIGDGQSTSL